MTPKVSQTQKHAKVSFPPTIPVPNCKLSHRPLSSVGLGLGRHGLAGNGLGGL